MVDVTKVLERNEADMQTVYTLRFGSQFEANLFEKALQDQQIQFERSGPVTIQFPNNLSEKTVDWLEWVSGVHTVGRRG